MVSYEVNYLAVAVAALAALAIGFVWYGPAFGKTWMRLAGIADKKPDTSAMIKSTIAGYISSLVMAFVLAVLIGLEGSGTIAGAVTVAGLAWLGFIATTQIGSVLWEGKSLNLFGLNTAYSLVSAVVVAAIVAAWP